MRAKRSNWFVFGTALGLGTVAAAIWWVRRRRKLRVQPLVLWAQDSGPPEVLASDAPQRSRVRQALGSILPVVLLIALMGGLLYGLVHSTWAIDGAVDASGAVLARVSSVRDELVASGQASQATRWLDKALQPATYSADVLAYLKEATAALPAESQEARRVLRAVIGELEGSR